MAAAAGEDVDEVFVVAREEVVAVVGGEGRHVADALAVEFGDEAVLQVRGLPWVDCARE